MIELEATLSSYIATHMKEITAFLLLVFVSFYVESNIWMTTGTGD